MKIPAPLLLILLLASGLRATAGAEIPAEQIEFFENRIRPVLSSECYECHSTHGKQKSGLVLDHREALLRGGDLGPAVVPGDPDESPLIWGLRHENDLEMPKAGVTLEAQVIEDFERWVEMGAPDPRDEPPSKDDAEEKDWPRVFELRRKWWSFQPITDPEVPAARDGWSEDPIDAFIDARREAAELSPSEPAEPVTLVRRAYFNLIGLPPTPEQVDAFKAAHERDPKTAFPALIDELLANERFGEKWARHWMDWVRYAESHGSEGDPRIPNAHLYRDYLIRALNRDVPYDQLLREHVAGDLLENPRIDAGAGINESMIGPAHFRMVFHGFALTDALDERVRFTDDQINAFTKAFQGLTVACARCHNHKFDAISQADYYAFASIFGSTRPGTQPIETREVLERNKAELAARKPEIRKAVALGWLQSLAGLEDRLLEAKIPEKIEGNHLLGPLQKARRAHEKGNLAASWKQTIKDWEAAGTRLADWRGQEPVYRWNLADPEVASGWFRKGIGLAEKPTPAGEFAIEPEGETILTGIFPAGIVSNALSQRHVAVLSSPDFDLSGKYELRMLLHGGGNALARRVIQNYPRKGTVFPTTRLGDGKGKDAGSWRWITDAKLDYWEGDTAHIELHTARDGAVEYAGDERSWFAIREAVVVAKGTAGSPDPSEEIGIALRAFAIENAATPREVAQTYARALAETVKAWDRGEIDDAGALLLDRAMHEGLLPNRLAELEGAKALIEEYRRLESEVPVPTRIPALAEWRGQDRPLYIRGSHKKPGEVVPRRFLDAVDPEPYSSELSGRRELAEDLLRPDNPFTRRVLVNRLWHHLFGRGIVATADNLGRLGEPPSHPELLDHLATALSEDHGWSLKKTIRSMVLSRTWQQASTPSEEAVAADPDNRLLSHFSVRRLEAEAIRDSLLAAAGRLGDPRDRSVFQPVIRNKMNPFLTAFDHPVPFGGKGVRNVTNVPAQALTMMNDPFVLGASQGLRGRFASLPEDERINQLWRTALGRSPSAEERRAVENYVADYGRAEDDSAEHLAEARSRLAEAEAERKALLEPVRVRLQAALDARLASDEKPEPIDLRPVAAWDFEDSADDSVGGLKGRLVGSAKIERGALVLDGKGALFTEPLAGDIGPRTLEVVVELDDLDQKGGGALTIQDASGTVFDSIVFAELRPREWLAGSDHHRRTNSFPGNIPEAGADVAPVRITIAYDADGTIRGYRNGEVLGDPFRKAALHTFAKGAAHLAFGVRHGTGVGGGRMLLGRIHEARFFDRALTAEEITTGSRTLRTTVTQGEILEALGEETRADLSGLDKAIAATGSEIEKLTRDVSKGAGDPWEAVALSILNFKEFIYVR